MALSSGLSVLFVELIGGITQFLILIKSLPSNSYRNSSNSTRTLTIAAPLYGPISLCLIVSNSCRTDKLHCCHGNLNCHHTV